MRDHLALETGLWPIYRRVSMNSFLDSETLREGRGEDPKRAPPFKAQGQIGPV